MLRERRHDVIRVQCEPGDFHLNQIVPFGREEPVKITNMIVVPPPDWKPTGSPGVLYLCISDLRVFEAPIEILRAEWQRYQIGYHGIQHFHSVLVPVGKSARITNRSRETVIVDLFVSYYVHV